MPDVGTPGGGDLVSGILGGSGARGTGGGSHEVLYHVE
jgi:hypothetical protein